VFNQRENKRSYNLSKSYDNLIMKNENKKSVNLSIDDNNNHSHTKYNETKQVMDTENDNP
jgi:hypothetical protein